MLKLMPTPRFRISDFGFRILQFKKGFTLIELLIVISIIGILASLTLASYSGTQQKARDGVRKSDLTQIKRALELAKADCRASAFYPYLANYAALQTYLGTSGQNYMNPVPSDPQNASPQVYVFSPDTSNADTTTCPGTTPGTNNYSLSVKMERTSDQDGPASRNRCDLKPGVPTLANYVTGYYYVCNN